MNTQEPAPIFRFFGTTYTNIVSQIHIKATTAL
jgi:hypothetical protein